MILLLSYRGNRLVQDSVILAAFVQQGSSINKPLDFLCPSFAGRANFQLHKLYSDKCLCVRKCKGGSHKKSV